MQAAGFEEPRLQVADEAMNSVVVAMKASVGRVRTAKGHSRSSAGVTSSREALVYQRMTYGTIKSSTPSFVHGRRCKVA